MVSGLGYASTQFAMARVLAQGHHAFFSKIYCRRELVGSFLLPRFISTPNDIVGLLSILLDNGVILHFGSPLGR